MRLLLHVCPGVPCALLVLSLAACDDSASFGPEAEMLLGVDSVKVQARFDDSVRVALYYTLPLSCDSFVRLEATQPNAEAIEFRVIGTRSGNGCRSITSTGSVEHTIIKPIETSVLVLVKQPGGGEFLALIGGFPRLGPLCRGPSVWLTGLEDVVAGRNYVVVIQDRCRVLERPLDARWEVADTATATVAVQADSTAVLSARRAGSTRLTLRIVRNNTVIAVLESPLVVKPAP